MPALKKRLAARTPANPTPTAPAPRLYKPTTVLLSRERLTEIDQTLLALADEMQMIADSEAAPAQIAAAVFRLGERVDRAAERIVAALGKREA